MRTPLFSAEDLRSFLSRRLIASFEELKGAIGSPATSTVSRKLRELDYLSSYSHRGSYYTLPSIPKFDERGLWQHLSVGFSKHGNLIATCEVLVERSEVGMSAGQLDELLGVECKRALNQLYHDGKVTRRKFDGVYVYLAKDSNRRRSQEIAHSTQTTTNNLGICAGANADEVRAAIILFFSVLDEKQRRLFAGLESLKRGYGGDLFVSEWLDLDPHTVAKGRRELLDGDGEVRSQRVRRKGGGRKSVEKKRPGSSRKSSDS
jgi:hypothetical protein